MLCFESFGILSYYCGDNGKYGLLSKFIYFNEATNIAVGRNNKITINF